MRTPRSLALIATTIFASGCAGDAGANEDNPCRVSLGFTPSMPTSGPAGEVTVTASVQNAPGVLDYNWRVSFAGGNVDFTNAAANESAIRFTALDPGVYAVDLDVSAPGEQCPSANERINVLDPAGISLDVRLHVTAPFDLDVPPIDRLIRVYGGTDYALGPVVLDPGIPVTGTVRTPGNVGVPAYITLRPQGMAGAVTETFSNAAGAFDVTVLNQPHDVLVIPSVAGLAPRRYVWSPTQPNLTIDAGGPIVGVVRHGASPLANAKVQLTIDGVPTTLATTASDGSFTMRGNPGAVVSPQVKVEVTPAAASGLPRLEAQAAFDIGAQVVVTYNSTLTTRNIGGTTVRRGGAALATRKVTVVGALASIGTVSAGINANASGFTRITVTSDGGGALPSVLAPAGPLSAVVAVDVTDPELPDLAVSPFDLSTAVPATIDAPTMRPFATQALGQGLLDGVRVDLVPVGALALASTPTLQLRGDANGRVATSIAAGGFYDVYFSDPQGRSGQRIVTNVAWNSVGLSYLLDPAVSVSGTLSVTGNPNKIRGASVQLLCATCSGLDRDRPIAEVASDEAGDFVLAVPDPGTM
ncbi:MAG: hypothetical protein H0T42_31540 [Deltaproteobacteria bacterium]|nr:hypothetical protein [Deltaproteobacteria bacterium]